MQFPPTIELKRGTATGTEPAQGEIINGRCCPTSKLRKEYAYGENSQLVSKPTPTLEGPVGWCLR